MDTKEYPAIWLQAAGCTGCSVSLLNVINPSIKNLLVDEVLPGSHINLRFHPTVMAGSGAPVIEAMVDTSQQKKGAYILIVEGAIPTAKAAQVRVRNTWAREPNHPASIEGSHIQIAR